MKRFTLVAFLCCALAGYAADDSQTELLLGIAAQQKGDNAEAEKHFRRALEFDPRYADAHYHLAIVLIATGKRDEGREHLAWAFALKPRSAQIRDEVAMSLAKLGYVADAEVLLREAIKKESDYVPAMRHLAELLYTLNRREEAANAFKAACLTAPFDATLHHDYAMILYQLSRKREAEKELREAIRLNDAYALAHYRLGLLLYERGAAKEAEAQFKQAIAADDGMVDAYNTLGQMLKVQRRTDEAIDVFEKLRGVYVAGKDTNQVARIDQLLEELQPPKPAAP